MTNAKHVGVVGGRNSSSLPDINQKKNVIISMVHEEENEYNYSHSSKGDNEEVKLQ